MNVVLEMRTTSDATRNTTPGRQHSGLGHTVHGLCELVYGGARAVVVDLQVEDEDVVRGREALGQLLLDGD